VLAAARVLAQQKQQAAAPPVQWQRRQAARRWVEVAQRETVADGTAVRSVVRKAWLDGRHQGLAQLPIVRAVSSRDLPIVEQAALFAAARCLAQLPIVRAVSSQDLPIVAEAHLLVAGLRWAHFPIAVAAQQHSNPRTTDRYDNWELHNSAFHLPVDVPASPHPDILARPPEEWVPTNCP
jgi:hypothetical protein